MGVLMPSPMEKIQIWSLDLVVLMCWSEKKVTNWCSVFSSEDSCDKAHAHGSNKAILDELCLRM
jgi:hypothetical protein